MVVGGVLRAQTSAYLSQSSSSHLHVREVGYLFQKTTHLERPWMTQKRYESGRRRSVSSSLLEDVISCHVPDVCAHRARAGAPAPQDTVLIMHQPVKDTETPALYSELWCLSVLVLG